MNWITAWHRLGITIKHSLWILKMLVWITVRTDILSFSIGICIIKCWYTYLIKDEPPCVLDLWLVILAALPKQINGESSSNSKQNQHAMNLNQNNYWNTEDPMWFPKEGRSEADLHDLIQREKFLAWNAIFNYFQIIWRMREIYQSSR